MEPSNLEAIMKEIDFLPKWYRDKRRRQTRYRIQYLGLACLVTAMTAWTVATVHSISRARAALSDAGVPAAQAPATQEYQSMKAEFARLHTDASMLVKVDPHVKTSGLLAEFSYLAGDNIKLSRLTITAEKLARKEESQQLPSNTIRAVRDAMVDKSGPYIGDIRYKVVVVGIAADATCVAQLIGRLEKSPWFAGVTPSYCKSGAIGEHPVSEFEITCYVNNYSESRRPVTASAAGSARKDTVQ
jgi:hypothetical protein